MTSTPRKLLMSLMTMLFSVTPALTTLTLAPASARAATTNNIIKGSGPTLYWYASNGKRYVFPNSQTFYSWYSASDFSRVQVIGDTELYTLPLGGNVTYRPGARLVKITTDPRVYAVSRYGTLRWITSESIARTLYGANWAQWVDDIPDAFFTNYTVGAPINNASEYNVNSEFNSVVNPSDNIGSASNASSSASSNTSNMSANLTVSMNATTFPTATNDLMRITALVTNASISTENLLINIYQEGVTAPEQTCWSVNNCVLVRNGSSATNRTIRYYAEVLERSSNRLINRSYGPTVTLNALNGAHPTFRADSFTLTANRTTFYTPNTQGDLTLTATVQNPSTPVQNLTIRIYDEGGRVLRYCLGTFSCTFSMGMAAQTTNVQRFYATVNNELGQQLGPAYTANITVYSYPSSAANSASTPSITYPTANQVLTTYPRAVTVQWRGNNSNNYRVQVDCDYCGTAQAWGGQPTYFNVDNYQTSVLIGGETLPGDNQYRVRVRAIGTDGSEGPWSEYIYFNFRTTNASVPTTPSITSPTNNKLLTNYPRTLEIIWSGSWAKRHVIEMACDICVSTTNLYSGTPQVFTTDNYATSKVITAGADNTYRIRVKGINENGVESAWSDYIYFTYETPAASAAFTGNVTMTADNTYITPPVGNTVLNMTATVTDSSVPTANLRIDLYADFNENYIQKTCLGTTTCTETVGFQNVTQSTAFHYYAVVSDDQGRQLQRAYTPYIKVMPQQ